MTPHTESGKRKAYAVNRYPEARGSDGGGDCATLVTPHPSKKRRHQLEPRSVVGENDTVCDCNALPLSSFKLFRSAQGSLRHPPPDTLAPHAKHAQSRWIRDVDDTKEQAEKKGTNSDGLLCELLSAHPALLHLVPQVCQYLLPSG